MSAKSFYYDHLMSPARKPVYVVYAVGSTKQMKSYQRKWQAEKAAASLNEKEKRYHGKHAVEFAVAELLEYEFEVVYWRQVKNLMSQKPVFEKSNLPHYLSVGSESYWSA